MVNELLVTCYFLRSKIRSASFSGDENRFFLAEIEQLETRRECPAIVFLWVVEDSGSLRTKGRGEGKSRKCRARAMRATVRACVHGDTKILFSRASSFQRDSEVVESS